MVSPLAFVFIFLYVSVFARRESLSQKKKERGAQWRIWRWYRAAGNKKAETFSFLLLYLKSCQAMSSEKKEGMRREEEYRGVTSVYLPKKVTVVYQLTIHS